MEKILTPAALWQDFDPAAEPLEANVLKTIEEDGLLMQTVYFTGRTVYDGKSRVLAKICSKIVTSKAPRPALLLIDNYKKPIDDEELKYWARNGFTAMAIDFAGRCTQGLCTLYPSTLDYCNGDVAKSYFYVGETAHESKAYEYALNCMRAITYLIQKEKVKTVSVVAVRKGVAIGAIVLGTDKRVTNGVVVFGSMHREYPEYVEEDQSVSELDSDELSARLVYEEKQQKWEAGIAPQSYAMRISVPVLMVCSANSSFVDAISINKIYYRMNEQSRMLMLPTVMDYISEEYTKNIVRWCKGNNVAEEAQLQPFVDENGNQCIQIVTELPSNKVELWYCRNSDTRARNWVKAPLKKNDQGYKATLDIYSSDCDIVAFALEKGVVDITTSLCEIEVRNFKNVKSPMRNMFSGKTKENIIPIAAGDGWHGDKHNMELCKGYLDIVGAKGNGLVTFALSDPCVRHNEVFTISFDVCCNTVQQLRVVVVFDYGSKNTAYEQSVVLTGDGKWQRVTLEGVNFHALGGTRQMPDYAQPQMIAFVADDEFIINNIFLV